MKLAFFAAAALAACLGGCASMSQNDATNAPQPAKPIDAARFFTGRWYEIARTPMKLTDGCVAGTTDYSTDADGKLIDTDACHEDTPEGKLKTFAGPVEILNPGQNTKVKVSYKVVGPFGPSRTYWMLDHGDDYGWFIVSDPQLKNVSFFTRNPRPSEQEKSMLSGRVQALGYNPSLLEFPTEFPEGER